MRSPISSHDSFPLFRSSLPSLVFAKSNMSEEGPPQKRQRTEESLDYTESPGAVDISESEAGIVNATPDEKYFWQDGDCCVRVETTLFNVG